MASQKNAPEYLLMFGILVLPIASCGLVADMGDFACGFLSGGMKDHCYQNLAITSSDPNICTGIEGKEVGVGDSNPPQDKCFLQIANNTNDPSLCDAMEGGINSYTPSECYQSIAAKTGNPDLCDKITETDMTTNKESCLQGVRASPNYVAPLARNLTSQEKEGEVTFVKGVVMVKPAGEDSWYRLEEGTELKPGDTIKTGPKSKVRVIHTGENKGIDIIPPDSERTLTKMEAEPGPTLTSALTALPQAMGGIYDEITARNNKLQANTERIPPPPLPADPSGIPRSVPDGDTKAISTFVKGDVMVKPAGSDQWYPITPDTRLVYGDTIKTGPNSKMRYMAPGEEGVSVIMDNSETVLTEKPKPPQDLGTTINDISQALTRSEAEGEVFLGTR
ncbi:MAG: hypothetical protein U0R44_05205 [Candidatus Micrarchaeia archaeon]